MARSIAGAAMPQGATGVARPPTPGATAVDLERFRGWIVAGMTATGYTYDALAAAMGFKDRSYVYRVLSGEKPMSMAFVVALPDDLESVVAGYYAEHHGHIVAQRAVTREAAVRDLVSGLVGLLETRLPERAGAPLKVDLDRKAVAR